MKTLRKLLPVVVVLSLFLTACSQVVIEKPEEHVVTSTQLVSTVIPTNTEPTSTTVPTSTLPPTEIPSPTPTLDPIEQSFLKFLLNHINLISSERLSPNGRWLVEGNLLSSISLVATEYPHQTLELPLPPEIMMGSPTMLFWSPDSTILVSQTQVGIYMFDNIILYNLEDPERVETYMFDPPGTGFLRSIWAPDSSKLAIFDGFKIYYLDRKANLLQTVDFIDEGLLPGTFWPEQGLMLHEKYDYKVDETYEEVRRYHDVLSPSDYDLLLAQNKFSFTILSTNESDDQLLLIAYRQENGIVKERYLWVFDIETREIQYEIDFPYSFRDSSNSIQKSWVAIAVVNINDEPPPYYLYIFDWETKSLVDYGPIQTLIGWRENVDGFLVVRTLDNGGEIEVIRP